jgi:hypothetical protein
MDPVWQYPFVVESVANTHPGMAAYLDRFNVRARKVDGDPFDAGAACQAEQTAKVLLDMSGVSDANVVCAFLLILLQIKIQLSPQPC